MTEIFKRLRHLASFIPDLLERVGFLSWLDKTEDVNRTIDVMRRAERLNIVVQMSPACDKAWVSELRTMKDQKRFHARVLIPVIERLIPIAENDQDITPRIRRDMVDRMKIIKSDLRHLASAS